MSSIPLPQRGSSASGEEHGDPAPAPDEARNAQLAQPALRISEGDPAALDELMDRFWVPLTSYASRILDDMTVAEDVVQEVFVRIWERRAGWEPRSVTGLLFRMTRNRALDAVWSRDARRKRESTRRREVPRHPRTPAGVLQEEELAEAVDRRIQSMPERQKEAFTLAYLENLSYVEVAEIMDISTKTVGNHISAALGHLREVLAFSPRS